MHHADAGSASGRETREDIDVIATTLEERLSEAIGGRADGAGDETRSARDGVVSPRPRRAAGAEGREAKLRRV